MSEVETLSKISTEFPVEWYEIAQKGHFWFEWRLQAFLKQLEASKISTNEPMNGLDIGCGCGLVRKQIEQHCSWVTDGADVDRVALEQNETIKGRTMLYNIRDCKKEFKENYDFIFIFDVLEHIEDTQEFINSALFHLKKGGFLFVNVPAINGLLSRYDRAVGHLRRYDKRMLSAELKTLDIVDMRYWGLSLLPLLISRGLFLSKHISETEVIQKGLNPPSQWVNQLLIKWMQLETALIKRPALGTSILAIATKPY